jgi:hypothetical protein
MLLTACQRELTFPSEDAIVINTSPVIAVAASSAISGGTISGDSSIIILARGVCYSSINANPVLTDSTTIDGSGFGSFVSMLTGLSTGTRYYVRAYLTSNISTLYGRTLTFNTKDTPGAQVTLTTSVPTGITPSTATCGGNILSDGGDPITERGICYDINIPTIAGNLVNCGSGTGVFSGEITGLVANTTYQVRAYAINSTGIFYGDQESFTTTIGSIPTITTTPIFTVTSVSAISGGNIIADNGSPITAKGICYSVDFNPTTANSLVSGGYGPGVFECGLSGLIPGTIYYVRAYATNSAGTAYGNQISFTTKT